MRKRRPPTPIRDVAGETQLFRSRALICAVIVLLGFMALGGRFAWLQLMHQDEFTTRSEANRLRLRALPPNRGLIYDRNGNLLADNRPAYRLELIPEQTPNVADTVQRLSQLISITAEDRDRFDELRRARRSFQSIPLRLRLSSEEAAVFAVNRHRFQGVEIVPYLNRQYPHGEAFAHVVGYVGRIGPDDLRRLDENEYVATTHIGKIGLERHYEASLHGVVGYEQVEVDAQGRILKTLDRKSPLPGADLVLTIDAGLQQAAVEALGGRAGAVVAIEPATAEVLAFVSQPGFDPNLFVNGISHADYSKLINSSARPLFNRALNGGYEPGSTIKPYIALAGLDGRFIDAETTIFSRGYYQLPGHEQIYRDWKREGHGEVDVGQAIAQSVNVFFYQLATQMGIDRLHDYLSQFGFGSRTGIDLGGESSGILPSREWKRATRNEPWYPGETVIAGIGQGFIVATPLQLANALALMVTDGKTGAPHLVREIVTPDGVIEAKSTPTAAGLNIPPQHWELVRDGLKAVLHHPRGTAFAVMSDRPGFEMAGKSGTAQVYGTPRTETEEEQLELPEHLRHHALFVAFAPVQEPAIAVAVVVEHGGGGSTVAAPLARHVIEAYLSRAVSP